MTQGFIPMYDLESLNEQQRSDYLKAVCAHMGIPDNLNLVALTYIDDGEGPARLVPYVKRGGAEAIRNNLGITITSLTNQMIGGSIVFTATGTDKNGRQEVATGSKFIDGLSGTQLDDSVMTASTRALRRLSIQFIGAAVLDESEVNQRKTIHITSESIPPAPQPAVEPSNQPGKVVELVPEQTTPPPATIAPEPFSGGSIVPQSTETLVQIAAPSRAEVIAKLNEEATPEPAKKTRKPRSPNKKKIDMGPSEPAPVRQLPQIAGEPAPQPITAPISAPVVVTAPVSVEAPITPAKPRLTPEQVRPFRQRHFRLVQDYLEPNGFAPKEGMGNADKLRLFAQMMFPEISNMNDLSVEQWEHYLTTLEKKVKTEGPAAAVKFIEDAIGI